MTTKYVDFCSHSKLPCAFATDKSVILCLESSDLVAPTECPTEGEGTYSYSFIEAEVCQAYTINDGCNGVWYYKFRYDNTQLNADMGVTQLISSNITGVFCTDCLTTYIDEKVGDEIFVSYDDEGNAFLHSQHGCTYAINSGTSSDCKFYASQYGDYDDAAIQAALDAIGATEATLYITCGTWDIQNDIVSPSNVNFVMLQGAVLDVASGKSVTINGPFDAPITQIFSGDGRLYLGAESVKEAYTEWFGAIADGTTICTDAFQNALEASRTVKLLEGTYLIGPTAAAGDFMLYIGSNASFVNKDGLLFSGLGPKSIIKLADNINRNKLLFGSGNTDVLTNMTFRDFAFDLNGENNLNTGGPLRYNSAFYLSSVCTNMLFENLTVLNGSGSQLIRVGKDSLDGVATNVKFINCRFKGFGEGIPGNHTQDVSVIYLNADEVVVQDCIFENDDFTFNLAKGQTAIELHGVKDHKIINNTFRYLQLPILLASVHQDLVNTTIQGNVFYETNYLMSFDNADTDHEQSRVNIIGNIFQSTKSTSIIIPFGASGESQKIRSQIDFVGNTMNGTGNTNYRTHIFRIENTYLNSLFIAGNDVADFLGSLVYLVGTALPTGAGKITIVGNRLDSLGNVGGGTFPTDPTMIHVNPTADNIFSLVIEGNTFFNTAGKDYSGLGVIRRAGDIDYVRIANNAVHLDAVYPVITGTLGTTVQDYEQYTGATGGSISNGKIINSGTIQSTGFLVGIASLQTGQLARLYNSNSGAVKPVNTLMEVESASNTGYNVSVGAAADGGYFISTPAGAYWAGIDWDENLDVLNITAKGTNAIKYKENGQTIIPSIKTNAGGTGDQTINLPSGSVNFAAGATTLKVTNSMVSATSFVFVQIVTNDATAALKNVVPGAGFFDINLSTAPTAETRVCFWVIN